MATAREWWTLLEECSEPASPVPAWKRPGVYARDVERGMGKAVDPTTAERIAFDFNSPDCCCLTLEEHLSHRRPDVRR